MSRHLRLTSLAIAALAASSLRAQAVRQTLTDNVETLPRGDEQVSGPVSLGFAINVYGSSVANVYVSTNGFVTFRSGLTGFNPDGFSRTSQPIFAPFYADVDTSSTQSGQVSWGRGTVDGRAAFGVTWTNVGYANAKVDKTNTFQIVLISRPDRAQGDFDVEFNYDKIQWEAGDANGGRSGLCGVPCEPALAGYTDGRGLLALLEGSRVAGAFLDSNSNGLRTRRRQSQVPGRLVYTVDNGAVVPAYIDSISPSSAVEGSGATPITISGAGFTPGATVWFNLNGVTTPLDNVIVAASSRITATIPTARLSTSGTAAVTVQNLIGPPSAPALFTVTPRPGATPQLSSLSPSSANAGSPATSVTINGSGFIAGAIVRWIANNATQTLARNVVSPTQITATIPASFLTAPVDAQVEVVNTIGSPPSNRLTFRVVATGTTPVITSMNPPSVPAGSVATALTITGTGFASGLAVRWTFGGQTTTLQNSQLTGTTQISVQIPANLLSTAGTAQVVVANPGGLTSQAATFTITTAAPTITQLAPNSVVRLSGDTVITITGTGFAANSTVRWTLGGQVTTLGGFVFVSATSVRATVPAAQLAAAGTAQVAVVTNNVASAAAGFAITALPPISATITPSTAVQPSLTFTLASAPRAQVTGTLTLSFRPNAAGLPTGYIDPAVRFASGGATTLNFTAPAGATTITLPNNGTFSRGTVAGNVDVTLTALTSAGDSILPATRPFASVPVARTAPVIVPGSVRIVNVTGNGFSVEMQASSSTRDLVSAALTFSAAGGTALDGSTTATVQLTPQTAWFASAAGLQNGSRFTLTIPFTFSGDASALGSVSATLTNSVGVSAAVSGGR